MRGGAFGSHSGFTLVELLTVIAIVVILAAISVTALVGVSGAKQFTRSIDQIQGILDQAREYAIAQNTFVWVLFYPVDPSTLTPPDNSGDALYVAVVASNDGSDPVNFATPSPATIPYATGTTTVALIMPVVHIKQVAIGTASYFTQAQIPSLPVNFPSTPTPPGAKPAFSVTGNGLSLPVASAAGDISGSGNVQNTQNVSVVQFTPTGAARTSSSPIDSIWINFERTKAYKAGDTKNIAAIRINGLIGLTTVYRD